MSSLESLVYAYALTFVPGLIFLALANLPTGDIARWSLVLSSGGVVVVWLALRNRGAPVAELFWLLFGGAVAMAVLARVVRRISGGSLSGPAWAAFLAGMWLMALIAVMLLIF